MNRLGRDADGGAAAFAIGNAAIAVVVLLAPIVRRLDNRPTRSVADSIDA